jgi:hypothetical protein
MNQMSEAAGRLLTKIVLDRHRGPQHLLDAWTTGQITDADLPAIIPDTWLYMDWPERVIGAAHWAQIFRAVGFITVPPTGSHGPVGC